MRNLQQALIAVVVTVAGLVVYHAVFAPAPPTAAPGQSDDRDRRIPESSRSPELHADVVRNLSQRIAILEEQVESRQTSVEPASATAERPVPTIATDQPTAQEVDHFMAVMKEVDRRRLAEGMRNEIRAALTGVPVNLSAVEEDRLVEVTLGWKAKMEELFSHTPQVLDDASRDKYVAESTRISDEWKQDVLAAVARADGEAVLSALQRRPSGNFLRAGGGPNPPVSQAPPAPQAPQAPLAPSR